jgi:hypothetical protein
MSQVRRFFWLAFALSWGIGGVALLIGRSMPELRPLSTSSPLYFLNYYWPDLGRDYAGLRA